MILMRMLGLVDIWAAQRWRVGIFAFAIIAHYLLAAYLTLEVAGLVPANTVSATTPVHQMVKMFGVLGAAVAFGTAAFLAHIALIVNGRARWYWRVALILWQQAVITMSMIDIIGFVIAGRYADGYVVHPIFIAADQTDGTLLLGAVHTLAVLHFILFLLFQGDRIGGRT